MVAVGGVSLWWLVGGCLKCVWLVGLLGKVSVISGGFVWLGGI